MYKNLYNNNVLDTAAIFASKARFKVLRTLYYQRVPIRLRHIAYLSGAPLFSVQRVLQQLVDEKMVVRKRKRHYVLFSLDRDHEHYSFLAQLFELEMKNQIAFLSNDYHSKAKSVLRFSRSAQRVIKGARSWTLKNFSQKS